jgi:thymidylate synthase ThyX
MSSYLSEAVGYGGIYARVVEASVSPEGVGLYTIETCAPKFLDAEVEKHRMLSSNSSSSRAIPFKALDQVYLPQDVRKKEKGMQGYEEIDKRTLTQFHNSLTLLYFDVLMELGLEASAEPRAGVSWHSIVHKQHLNRYLEPWTLQRKVITGTEWENFFKLRTAADAQPEMQELAKCMRRAMLSADAKELVPGQWHLPYITAAERASDASYEALQRASAARCARVSYNNHDQSTPSLDKDIQLFERLRSIWHWTPMEHQATPMKRPDADDVLDDEPWDPGVTHCDRKGVFWSANFRGWVQHRQLLQEWNP